MKEALKLAEQSIKDLIYALAEGRITGDDYQPVELEAFSVLDAIKEALAQPSSRNEIREHQPAQEPVAWMHEWEDGERVPQLHPSDDRLNDPPTSVRPLVYGDTAPPQRPWVGLTNAEKQEIYRGTMWGTSIYGFADAIEAKLKEKNT